MCYCFELCAIQGLGVHQLPMGWLMKLDHCILRRMGSFYMPLVVFCLVETEVIEMDPQVVETAAIEDFVLGCVRV